MVYIEYHSPSEAFEMKTQVALRLEESLVEFARRRAERDNRSLANFVEGLLADALMSDSGDAPVISLLDDDFAGAVALDDSGAVDEAETERLHRLLGSAAI